MSSNTRALFLWSGNSCRSHMAEKDAMPAMPVFVRGVVDL